MDGGTDAHEKPAGAAEEAVERKEVERKEEAVEHSNSEDDDDDDDIPDPDPPMAGEPGAELQAMDSRRSLSEALARAAASPGPRRSSPAPDPPPALSRTSTRSGAGRAPPTVVPRSRRRGLFGQLAVLPEVERPYEYANRTKWLITLIVSLSAAGGPMGSSILYPALRALTADLHTSDTVANLNIALYMLAMGIFPLWWSSFSETLGRRTIYLISFSLFVVFSILSAVSSSIAMLIVMRVLGGGASASVQAVGAGTLADIWEPRERGRAMGIFYLGPLTGPLFAPIIGGALAERWGWKSTMWFLAIYGGLTLVMLFSCLPETLARDRRRPEGGEGGEAAEGAQEVRPSSSAAPPAASTDLARTATRQSARVHAQRAARFLRHAFVHPLSVLLYLRFPPILLTVVYGAVTFGALFVLNVSVQSVFARPPYGFGELVVGLLYIPNSLGYILASLLGGRWIDRIMAREARRAGRYDARGRLVYLPEDRMRENAWLSASLFPAALVWFGWTAQRGVFWFVPMLANFFFGVGSMLVFGAVTTMLTEFMPRRSSGGIALNNFLRNIFSCVGALVAQPLIAAMGVGWLCTMVALLAWLVGNACIFLLRRHGAAWRVQMDQNMSKQP